MFSTVVAVLLLTALLFQVVHIGVLAGAQLKVSSRSQKEDVQQPVSVIICARNEAVQLAQRLPLILAQDYHQNRLPLFEVIVADDASTDETAAVVTALQKDFPHLRYFAVPQAKKPFKGKKGALALAVKNAKQEVLLLTDADCKPASPHWISHMTCLLTAGKELIAGYAPYEEREGFLNAFIRAEALLAFLHIAAFHRFGIPYMATGRNLLVRRQTFEGATRHPLWSQTLSGDDDMLVRLAATAANFAVQPSPEAAMHSGAKRTLKEYVAQKQRHMSTGKYYRFSVKLLLFLLNGSQFLFWAVLPFAFFSALAGGAFALLWGALAGALLRIAFFAVLLFRAARRQGGPMPFFFFPFFDAAIALHSLFFAPYIFWKNKTTWK